MVELRWAGEAEVSLRDIHDYIARDRPATARRTIDSIISRVESLREFPRLGQAYPYQRQRPLRILTYGQFQIAYLLLEDAHRITVLGIFHGLIFLPLK